MVLSERLYEYTGIVVSRVVSITVLLAVNVAVTVPERP